MPDHVHLLLEGLSESSDLQRFVTLAKQRSGWMFARRSREWLWQEGFYDRVLREGDDVGSVARYVIANPVRAGLVASPAEYPYLGSDVWSLDELLEGLV